MYLSYLTDEMHKDFEEAVRLGADWGLHHAEIRTVDGVNVLEMSDAQIARARDILDRYNMRVSAIATPFLKCTLPGQQEAVDAGPMHGAATLTYEDHLALLGRGVEVAQLLGSPYMRIFSFWREEDVDFWPALQAAVSATLAVTEGTGITPCLENEGACFIGTSAELAEAAQRLTDPRLKFIYDPGNSSYRGMPPRAQDFAIFANRIGLVHVKDCRNGGADTKPTGVVLGSGETDYHVELRRIAASGYAGALTFEPHYAPNGDLTEGMRQSVAALRALAAEVQIDFA